MRAPAMRGLGPWADRPGAVRPGAGTFRGQQGPGPRAGAVQERPLVEKAKARIQAMAQKMKAAGKTPQEIRAAIQKARVQIQQKVRAEIAKMSAQTARTAQLERHLKAKKAPARAERPKAEKAPRAQKAEKAPRAEKAKKTPRAEKAAKAQKKAPKPETPQRDKARERPLKRQPARLEQKV